MEANTHGTAAPAGPELLLNPADLHAAAAILRDGPDTRAALCEAAVRILRADVASLWEAKDEWLMLTASTDPGLVAGESRMPLGGNSAAASVGRTGRGRFVQNAIGHPDVDGALVRRLRLRSLHAEPVTVRNAPLAALVLGWRHHIEPLSPLSAAHVTLLAAQASKAVEHAELAERLQELALSDPLTGLPNRRGLARELEREMARARRDGRRLGFAVLDLDRFKDFNDTYGHQAGDRVLVRTARAWSAQLRGADVLARYGGEEFVLLLPGCETGAHALAACERVRRATPDDLTASAGVATWDGVEPPHTLLDRADRALYAAKDEGRDRALLAA
jgi:diguanylate cyclase (GGDEF)-like protein